MEDFKKAGQSQAVSLDHYWMPFTANRQFKQNPRLLAQAEGMYYKDVDGRPVLDATARWMPWQSEAMKGVITCDKPRLGSNNL